MAQNIFAEILPLRWDDFQCPLIDLDVNGAACTFVVDTGCNVTSVSLQQVEAWGVADKIIPVADPESMGYLGFFEITLSFNSISMKVNVIVEDMEWNLLGCNILVDLCCIINLDPSHPTLAIRSKAHVAETNRNPTKTVTLAGHDMEVIPDTGSSMFLTCDLMEIAHLSLEYQDVPDDLYMGTPDGP